MGFSIGLIKDCNSTKKETSILAKLILFDLKNFINHPAINKENSTAKALENRIALLGDGKTSDALPKNDPEISVLLSDVEISTLPTVIHKKICSNFREKGDAIFYNSKLNTSYKVSIKSLIESNKEINFGSFEFTSLVKNILDERFQTLGERKSLFREIIENEEIEIGRGSKKQLNGLFRYIKSLNKWDKFIERFEICLKGVFKEDIFIYIKDFKVLKIYIISNQAFTNCVINSLKNYDNNNSKLVITRWEGNSIRMERDLLIENSDFTLVKEFKDCFDDNLIQSKIQDIENIKFESLIKALS